MGLLNRIKQAIGSEGKFEAPSSRPGKKLSLGTITAGLFNVAAFPEAAAEEFSELGPLAALRAPEIAAAVALVCVDALSRPAAPGKGRVPHDFSIGGVEASVYQDGYDDGGSVWRLSVSDPGSGQGFEGARLAFYGTGVGLGIPGKMGEFKMWTSGRVEWEIGRECASWTPREGFVRWRKASAPSRVAASAFEAAESAGRSKRRGAGVSKAESVSADPEFVEQAASSESFSDGESALLSMCFPELAPWGRIRELAGWAVKFAEGGKAWQKYESGELSVSASGKGNVGSSVQVSAASPWGTGLYEGRVDGSGAVVLVREGMLVTVDVGALSVSAKGVDGRSFDWGEFGFRGKTPLSSKVLGENFEPAAIGGLAAAEAQVSAEGSFLEGEVGSSLRRPSSV